MTKEPKVVFENSELLVLDKPYGLTVNRSDTTKNQQTLQDFVEDKITDVVDKESDFYKRSGIVHRLDKDTSGLIIVAKTPEAFQLREFAFSLFYAG